MPKKKPAPELTTDEVAKKLFPKKVVEKAKEVAALASLFHLLFHHHAP